MIALWEGGGFIMEELITRGEIIYSEFDEQDSLSIKKWVAQASLYIDSAYNNTVLQNKIDSLRKNEVEMFSKEGVETLLAAAKARYERDEEDLQSYGY